MNKQWDELKKFVEIKSKENNKHNAFPNWYIMGLTIVKDEMDRIENDMRIQSLAEAGYF